MKQLIQFLLLLVWIPTFGRSFYVSFSTGNDSNNGLTPETAWKTTTKVNSMMNSFLTNDSIAFKAGDSWFGSIIVKKGYLTFCAYGTINSPDDYPIIDGGFLLQNWVQSGSNYYTSINAKYSVNWLTVNGVPWQTARYPNSTSLPYTEIIDSVLVNGVKTATDTFRVKVSGVGSNSNYLNNLWVMKFNNWRLERDSVIKILNDTVWHVRRKGWMLSSTNQKLENCVSGYQGFFAGAVSMLDTVGEWLYTNGRFYINTGGTHPSTYQIYTSLIDTLFDAGNYANITVTNIHFKNAGRFAVRSYASTGFKIKDVKISGSGAVGLMLDRVSNSVADNVSTENCLSTGIFLESNFPGYKNNLIQNCTVHNTGTLFGMGSFNSPAQYNGISAGTRDTLTVRWNNVVNSGNRGIQWQGNRVRITQNFVDTALTVLMDGGLIYTYAGGTLAKPELTYTDREVTENIVMNSIGTLKMTPHKNVYVAGIYLDGRSMNVKVLNNTVFNSGKNGIHMNNPSNIYVAGNMFVYDSIPQIPGSGQIQRGISFFKWAGDTIINLVIKNNLVYSYIPSFQYNVGYTTSNVYGKTLASMITVGTTIDSNYYSFPNSTSAFRAEAYNYGKVVVPNQWDLTGWRNSFGFDANSILVPSYPRVKTTLLTNPTKIPMDVDLENITGVNHKGESFSGIITIQPYRSELFFETGTTGNPNPSTRFIISNIKPIKQ